MRNTALGENRLDVLSNFLAETNVELSDNRIKLLKDLVAKLQILSTMFYKTFNYIPSMSYDDILGTVGKFGNEDRFAPVVQSIDSLFVECQVHLDEIFCSDEYTQSEKQYASDEFYMTLNVLQSDLYYSEQLRNIFLQDV